MDLEKMFCAIIILELLKLMAQQVIVVPMALGLRQS